MKKKNTVVSIFVIITFIFASFASVVMATDTEKIDLNTATIEDFSKLKGVGKTYAERIVNYREQNGPFKKIDDILLVKGIGEKTFEAIKDQLTINGEPQE